MIYKGKGGIKYNLESSPFTQGGEGKIYNIIGEPNKVAKLYKNGLNDSQKERKLLVMVNNPPNQEVMSQIAWPLDVLYDSSNTFVGFIMPKLDINEDLNVIYEYGASSKYPNVPWRNKITIARNLCAVLDAVHEVGHVVGDFNPKNISVDPETGHIIFVDTDSYHIEDNGAIYRCNVGMPEYLPVEIQKKMKGGLASAPLPTFSKATDNFALAVHIFQLLMNGTHPFACRVLPSQASVVFPQPSDNIINGIFPFLQPKSGISIPVYAPPISILPQELQDMFRRAFIDGHSNPNQRPNPEEWYNALTKLERSLTQCGKVKHHEFYNGISLCPWCEADNKFNQGVVTAKKTQMVQSTIQQSMKPAYVSAPRTQSQPQSSIYTSTGSRTQGGYTGTYVGGGYSSSRNPSKRKLVIIISMVVSMVLALIIGLSVGLTNRDSAPKTIQLTAPSSIRVSNGEVVWNSVKDANSYVVLVDNREIPVSSNSFKLDASFEPGSYSIAVKAKGSTSNINESSYSATINVVKPSTATNLIISEGILRWDAVTGYSTYRVEINGTVVDTINNDEYSLIENIAKISAGVNSIGVIVAGDSSSTIDSNCSNKISINKLNTPLNINVNEDTLSWQNVNGALGYIVSITNGTSTQSISLGAGINTYYLLGKLQKGTYQISVQAIGNNNSVFNSDASANYSYNLTETIIGISSKAELTGIANDLTAKYILQNDIDVSDVEWTPIGTIANRFEGVLIGNGHSIVGLSFTSKDTKGAGFFGVVGESGIISDLTFKDANISGGSTGYIGAVAGINYGTVFDVTVSGNVGVSNTGENIGGFFGRNYGSIYNCTNKATIKGGTNVGGIAGNFEFNNPNMIFSNCINEGVVSGNTRVGGLIGYIRVARMVYVDKLTNNGVITASGQYVGGICGYVEGVSGQTGNFEACFNYADIIGSNYVGGCFGFVGNYINIAIGNLSDPSLDCGNTGTITATGGNNKGNIKGN